jgi:hypothetical protein
VSLGWPTHLILEGQPFTGHGRCQKKKSSIFLDPRRPWRCGASAVCATAALSRLAQFPAYPLVSFFSGGKPRNRSWVEHP